MALLPDVIGGLSQRKKDLEIIIGILIPKKATQLFLSKSLK